MKTAQIKISESMEQQALFRWAAYQSGKFPELVLLYHVPNEGKRSVSAGARLKAEGLKKGVPDLCLPVARGKYHGLYIELKAQGGRLTGEQAGWLSALNSQGYKAVLCVGYEAAADEIMRYLQEEMA